LGDDDIWSRAPKRKLGRDHYATFSTRVGDKKLVSIRENSDVESAFEPGAGNPAD
jgi:hypothetical protein